MASPGAMVDQEASMDSPELNFSQIKSFTSLLKNISLVQFQSCLLNCVSNRIKKAHLDNLN